MWLGLSWYDCSRIRLKFTGFSGKIDSVFYVWRGNKCANRKSTHIERILIKFAYPNFWYSIRLSDIILCNIDAIFLLIELTKSFHLYFFLYFRCPHKHTDRFSNRWRWGWSAADSVYPFLYDLCTFIWIFGRSVLEASYNGNRCIYMESDDVAWIIHEHVWMVSIVPCHGGCWRSII